MRPLILFHLLFFVVLSVYGQTNVTLILTGDKVDSVTHMDFYDMNFRERFAPDFSDTLHFSFKESYPADMYNIRCFIDDRRFWAQLWLDHGNITIKARLLDDRLHIDTIINSPIQKRIAEFNEGYRSVSARDGDRDQKDDIVDGFLLEQMRKNIGTPYAMEIGSRYLGRNSANKAALNRMKEVFAQQDTAFARHFLYENVVGRMNKLLELERLAISAFRFIGKDSVSTAITPVESPFYLIDFWFLECAPCRRDHQWIKANRQRFHDAGIAVIGLSIDPYSREWEKYLIENAYDWDNYLDSENGKLSEHLGINSFPTYLLFNNEWELVGMYNNIMEVPL